MYQHQNNEISLFSPQWYWPLNNVGLETDYFVRNVNWDAQVEEDEMEETCSTHG
jgi:hypothetical protein